MYLRLVEIKSRSYAATPTQVSTFVTPPSPAAQKSRYEKSGGYAETLPPQLINNSAAVQQER